MSRSTRSTARALPRPDSRKIWLGTMMIVMTAVALLIAGCGSGDADEPSGPGQPVVQIPGSGGNAGPAAVAGGTTNTSGSDSATATTTPVIQLGGCNIDSLNNGRFLGTGLTVIAIIDEAQCPICSSGESCTTSSGQCRCLVVSS